MRAHAHWLAAALGTWLCGCGPAASHDDDGGEASTGASSSVGSPTTTGTTSFDPATTTATTTTADAGTDDGAEGSAEDEGTDGCTFTCPPPPPPPPMGGNCNCPPGEKCMPRSIDGTDTWSGVRCSPIAPDPGAPGDPCTVEGNQWSGVDDCEYGSMCFGVDPETNEGGTCVTFCSWFGGPCADGSECQVQPGELGLPLCVPNCDPTAPECADGLACFAGGSSFTCQPTAEARAPVGAPCPDPTACEAGALCAFDLDCGQAVGEGCCAEVCDLGQPDPCPAMQTCGPWFGGAGGAEWAHVGYCAP